MKDSLANEPALNEEPAPFIFIPEQIGQATWRFAERQDASSGAMKLLGCFMLLGSVLIWIAVVWVLRSGRSFPPRLLLPAVFSPACVFLGAKILRQSNLDRNRWKIADIDFQNRFVYVGWAFRKYTTYTHAVPLHLCSITVHRVSLPGLLERVMMNAAILRAGPTLTAIAIVRTDSEMNDCLNRLPKPLQALLKGTGDDMSVRGQLARIVSMITHRPGEVEPVRCPSCKYDRRGLPHQVPCPECGYSPCHAS
jgi:hypothetical protein